MQRGLAMHMQILVAGISLSLEYRQDAGSTILIAGTFGPPSERHLRC
jgi:hypothetical protein